MPKNCPLDGFIDLKIDCLPEFTASARGFLVSGVSRKSSLAEFPLSRATGLVNILFRRHYSLQDPNDNSMLDMLIGYSYIQTRLLFLLLLLHAFADFLFEMDNLSRI